VFRQPAPPVIPVHANAGSTGAPAAVGKPIATIATVDEG
jgi:hypothetical protein